MVTILEIILCVLAIIVAFLLICITNEESKCSKFEPSDLIITGEKINSISQDQTPPSFLK